VEAGDWSSDPDGLVRSLRDRPIAELDTDQVASPLTSFLTHFGGLGQTQVWQTDMFPRRLERIRWFDHREIWPDPFLCRANSPVSSYIRTSNMALAVGAGL